MLCGANHEYLDQPDAFREIIEFYVPADAIILDATYSKGVFWKRVTGPYTVVRMDRYPFPFLDLQADYEALPFRRESFDCVVFDPPYGNSSTAKRTDMIERQYNLESVCGEKAIYEAYLNGIYKIRWVLVEKGLFIVKCQNFISSGKQHWIEHDILEWAREVKFDPIDKLFVISVNNRPTMRHKHQLHARKWGSVFWIFRKK
jgi:tRNA G10  N-methylase Trm11